MMFGKAHKNWIEKCTEVILNHKNRNPFPKPPIAINYYNNPPDFCIGREEEIETIIREIKDSISSKNAKLIRIIGQQGIGKSTLICWCANLINENYVVPVAYLDTSSEPEDFKMRSLYNQIVSRLEHPNIINNLVIKSILKFIKIFYNSDGKLKQELSVKFSGGKIQEIIDKTKIILEKIQYVKFNEKLFYLLEENIIGLRNILPLDPLFLLSFWKSHVQNPELIHYLNAFKGTEFYEGYEIRTDAIASEYINKIIELIRWSFDSQTTLMLIIDHLEGGAGDKKEKVFTNLFSLLLNLRSKNYITIVLSGTLDAYNEFDSILQKDQSNQLENWLIDIALINLNPNDVNTIISKYLENFWKEVLYYPPHNKILFPFGSNSLKYLYEINGHNLRNTLRELYNLIETFKKNNKLDYIETFFQAFKVFRKRKEVALSVIEQKELVKKLLDNTIQDKKRSTDVEFALCEFYEILCNHEDYNYLSDVKHEPLLGKSKKKPDIFLEFFGNIDLESVKKVGIEVKVYRVMNEVPKKDVKKTYILLKDKALDYVSWITNVPLNLEARYDLEEELKRHLGRYSPLNDLELSYLAFARYFKEIYQRKPHIDEAIFILERLKITPLMIKQRVETLAKLTIDEIPKPKIVIDKYLEPSEEVSNKNIQELEEIPLLSVEINSDQIKSVVKKYIDDKCKKITKITFINTLKFIKKSLKLEESDDTWNNEIWGWAKKLCKPVSNRQTLKTIFFN